jgi:hypothetical protein
MTEPATPSSTASVPGLAEVLERLDRLEVALRELIAVTQARSTAPVSNGAHASQLEPVRVAPAPSSVTGQAGPGEPPVIYVAPARAPQRAEPVKAAIVDDSLRTYDPYAHRTDIEAPPPSATIHQVLTRVFEAGLMADQEDTWALMAKLTHPSQMQGPRALDHFKAFNWHKLRRTAVSYLKNGDPSTFSIAYTDPAEITANDDRVRVFLKVEDRMPVPVGFARDKTQGNAWRVTMMSI